MRSPRTSALTGRRVLVTGGYGFIGGHVCRHLRQQGAVVRVLDTAAPPPLTPRDIRAPLEADAYGDVDVIVHLAALAGVTPSLRDPASYAAANVTGTVNVLDLATRSGAQRVVVASSSSVYGHCHRPAHEDDALRPLSPYAASKVAAEEATRCFRGRFEQVIVRPFTVYGPGQRRDMLLGRMLRGESLTLWPFERDFTYVEDVAAAITAAAWRPLPDDSVTVNLGSGRPVAAADVVAIVGDVTGRPPPVEWGSPRSGEPRRTWADSGRAADILDFRPSVDLADGVFAQALATPGTLRAEVVA